MRQKSLWKMPLVSLLRSRPDDMAVGAANAGDSAMSSSFMAENAVRMEQKVDGIQRSVDGVQKRGRGRPRKSAQQDGYGSNDGEISNVERENQGLDNGEPTELIFKLERRGYGWGEEIIPHLTVEKRPVTKMSSRKPVGEMKVVDEYDGMFNEEDSALNSYLMEIGVPQSEVERLVSSAVAWRTTPGGRSLIDRRRQSRLTRNVKIVTKYLVEKCNVALGKDGVAAIFMRTPELMLCKPSNNDRWDRRAVELAAFLLKNGHCNVPEVYPLNPELGTWVKRQRVSRAAGQLSAERLNILERMGFEFGDLAQVTEEWETRFDQLVDWVLWHGESGEPFTWDLIHWGERGGITARELALWISLQREFMRRQLLPAEAVSRFEAVSPGWTGSERNVEESEWMSWLGRLVYVIERRRVAMRRPPAGKGNPFAVNRGRTGKDDSMTAGDVSGRARGDGTRMTVAKNQVFNIVATRRQAAASAPLVEDSGLRYWIARQRWLWRKSLLHPERVRMLQLAGIDMDTYNSDSWRETAHLAARILQKSDIELVSKRKNGPCTVLDAGIDRLKVQHWVETQRALFQQNRLSPGQLRYMAFLDLSWLLSDKVVFMEDNLWLQRWMQLKESLEFREQPSYELKEWLAHQRSLIYLNILDSRRIKKLKQLNICLEIEDPSPEKIEWDRRLGELLSHQAEVGHMEVTPENESHPGLSHWVEVCRNAILSGQMPAGKVAQLKALGIVADQS